MITLVLSSLSPLAKSGNPGYILSTFGRRVFFHFHYPDLDNPTQTYPTAYLSSDTRAYKVDKVELWGKEVWNVWALVLAFSELQKGGESATEKWGAYSPEKHHWARTWSVPVQFRAGAPAWCLPRPRSEPQPKEGRPWEGKLKTKRSRKLEVS